MKALQCTALGPTDGLKIAEVPTPKPGPGQVLVKMAGVGLNPWDVKLAAGSVSKQTPCPYIPGVEYSGTVQEVGPGVTELQPGDLVFGTGTATLAEFVVVDAAEAVKTSGVLDLPDWGAVPVAAMTAWQAVHDIGEVKPGERVLIHGASGGVGSYAVQFAAMAGAYVIGTSSSANLHYIKELGASETIDYRATAFETAVGCIDLVVDTRGGEVRQKSKQVMSPGGRLVSLVKFDDASEFEAAGLKAVYHSMKPNAAQLAHIRDLIEDMQLKVTITETVHLDSAAKGFDELALGHVRGKLLILA